MALRKLGKAPESPSGGSPTLYLDEEKDTRRLPEPCGQNPPIAGATPHVTSLSATVGGPDEPQVSDGRCRGASHAAASSPSSVGYGRPR